MSTPETPTPVPPPPPWYQASEPELEAIFEAAARAAGEADLHSLLPAGQELAIELLSQAAIACLELPKELFVVHLSGLRVLAMLRSALTAAGFAGSNKELAAVARRFLYSEQMFEALEAAKPILHSHIPPDRFDGHAARALIMVRDAIQAVKGGVV